MPDDNAVTMPSLPELRQACAAPTPTAAAPAKAKPQQRQGPPYKVTRARPPIRPLTGGIVRRP